MDEKYDELESAITEADASEQLIGGYHPIEIYRHYLSLAGPLPNSQGKDWDPLFKRLVHWQEARPDSTAALVISPDGQFLASSAVDGTVKLWGLAPFRVDSHDE